MNQFKQLCIWYQDHPNATNDELQHQLEDIYGVSDEGSAIDDVIMHNVREDCRSRGVNSDSVISRAAGILIEAISWIFDGIEIRYEDIFEDYDRTMNEYTFI